jgi:hypothetical protein
MTSALRKHLLQFACSAIPTHRLKLACARQVALHHCDRARDMLDHYLNGSGLARYVSTQDLLAQDRAVFARFSEGLRQQLNQSMTGGRLWIHQWDFSNRDWRFTLGGVFLDWDRCIQGVQVSFVERYDWHPDSVRPTRALHEAAFAMQKCGARPFDIIGQPAFFPLAPILSCPAPSKISPSDRLLC